jgi:hypothetical protein
MIIIAFCLYLFNIIKAFLRLSIYDYHISIFLLILTNGKLLQDDQKLKVTYNTTHHTIWAIHHLHHLIVLSCVWSFSLDQLYDSESVTKDKCVIVIIWSDMNNDHVVESHFVFFVLSWFYCINKLWKRESMWFESVRCSSSWYFILNTALALIEMDFFKIFTHVNIFHEMKVIFLFFRFFA